MENVCSICGEKLVVKMIPDFTGKGLHEEKVCSNDFCDSHYDDNLFSAEFFNS